MVNTGKEYEIFVSSIQQAILHADLLAINKNIKVEVDKRIIDNCGIERQFDIYWEYELGGITYKTVIECKDYNSRISVEKIDALIGKTCDIPDLKPVFATKKGYQSGAKIKAEQNKIDLLIVREQNESDWSDKDGNPLVKELHFNMQLQYPAVIKEFNPILNAEWVQNHTNLRLSEVAGYRKELSTDIVIEDLTLDKKYSLYDLGYTLASSFSGSYGAVIEDEITFDNAFIYYSNVKLKLQSYRIKYLVPKPSSSQLEIDFTKQLIGVVEYLSKGIKKSVFKDHIREIEI